MSYWKTSVGSLNTALDTTSFSSRIKSMGGSSNNEFYEIEPAVVLDIILDTTHPYFKVKKYTLPFNNWPVSINGKSPLNTDLDYTWIGRALVRLIYTEQDVDKEDLVWAIPLESSVSEYPVLNEVVGVVNYLGKYYYTRKINTFNTPNANADFNLELIYGGFKVNNTTNAVQQGNRELDLYRGDGTQITPYIGPLTKLNSSGNIGYSGVLGRYFYYNTRIRSLKRREGDLIFESRFGQSIRFGAYDDIRSNDSGKNDNFSGYADYKGNGIKNPFSKTEAGGGNPMIIIRNRQRPLNPSNPDEKNVGGYLLEDVNNDGSSIHMTSGVTLSEFQTTCLKKMWGNGSEEQAGFNGITSFVYPQLLGDQMVINSDRIIISSKKNEMFHFSKKRMSFVTDDELTLDAQNQIVITTNNKTVLNSPAIYLGEYNQTSEPVLLGQTTVNWLYELCNQMLAHTHWYNHTHPDAQGGTTGNSDANQTQTMIQFVRLQALQSNLQACLSRRVFVTGGGYAPGQDGGSLK